MTAVMPSVVPPTTTFPTTDLALNRISRCRIKLRGLRLSGGLGTEAFRGRADDSKSSSHQPDQK